MARARICLFGSGNERLAMSKTTNAEHRLDEVRELRAQAERCRRLAQGITDSKASRVLDDMAIGYEKCAATLAQG